MEFIISAFTKVNSANPLKITSSANVLSSTVLLGGNPKIPSWHGVVFLNRYFYRKTESQFRDSDSWVNKENPNRGKQICTWSLSCLARTLPYPNLSVLTYLYTAKQKNLCILLLRPTLSRSFGGESEYSTDVNILVFMDIYALECTVTHPARCWGFNLILFHVPTENFLI